jgi:hypothetical protein
MTYNVNTLARIPLVLVQAIYFAGCRRADYLSRGMGDTENSSIMC